MLYKRILAGTLAAVLILGTGCTGKTAESAETTETNTAAESDGSNSEPTVEPMVSMNAHSGKAVSAEQAKQERIRLVKKLAKGSLDDESAGYLADFINEWNASLSQSEKDNGMSVNFDMKIADYKKKDKETMPDSMQVAYRKTLWSGDIDYKGKEIQAEFNSKVTNYTVYSDGKTAYYEHTKVDDTQKETKKTTENGKVTDIITTVPNSAIHSYKYKIDLTDESNKTTVIGSAPVSNDPELISEFIDNIESIERTYDTKEIYFDSAGAEGYSDGSEDSDAYHAEQRKKYEDEYGQQQYEAGEYYKTYVFTLKYPVYEDIKDIKNKTAEPDGPNAKLTVQVDGGKIDAVWYTLGTDDEDYETSLFINFWYNPQGHEFTIEPPENPESYPDIKDAEYPYDTVDTVMSITELS